MEIRIVENLTKASDTVAARVRERLAKSGVYCLNVLGSPGSGKTRGKLFVDLEGPVDHCLGYGDAHSFCCLGIDVRVELGRLDGRDSARGFA